MSLGHTVGNYLALGASYEYADYSRLDTRVNDGYDVDYWGDVYEHSSSDEPMNRHTRETLKAVSTLKIGAEAKVMPNLAVRAGYNYVSPMFKRSAIKTETSTLMALTTVRQPTILIGRPRTATPWVLAIH